MVWAHWRLYIAAWIEPFIYSKKVKDKECKENIETEGKLYFEKRGLNWFKRVNKQGQMDFKKGQWG